MCPNRVAQWYRRRWLQWNLQHNVCVCFLQCRIRAFVFGRSLAIVSLIGWVHRVREDVPRFESWWFLCSHCADINACVSFPCSLSSGGCSDLPAPALNASSGRVCQPCLTGFSGNGETCTNINACISSPCSPNAIGCDDLPPPAIGDSMGRFDPCCHSIDCLERVSHVSLATQAMATRAQASSTHPRSPSLTPAAFMPVLP